MTGRRNGLQLVDTGQAQTKLSQSFSCNQSQQGPTFVMKIRVFATIFKQIPLAQGAGEAGNSLCLVFKKELGGL
jgi:hypothetical protein